MPKKKIVKFSTMKKYDVGEGKNGTKFYVIEPSRSSVGTVIDLEMFKTWPVPADTNVYALEGMVYDPKLKKVVESTEVKDNVPQKTQKTQNEEDVTVVDTDPEFGERADKAFKRVVQLTRDIQANFILLGLELLKIQDEQLYLAYGKSMNSFLASPEISIPASTAYRCMEIASKFILEYKIPQDELVQVGIKKLTLINPIAKEKKQAQHWIEKAKVLSSSDLQKEIKQTKKQPVYEIDIVASGAITLEGKNLILTTQSGEKKVLSSWITQYFKQDCNITATIKIRSKTKNKAKGKTK